MVLVALVLACTVDPPARDPPLPATPERRYRDWLAARGRSTADVRAQAMGGAGDWAFFHVSPAPGVHTWPAAVRDETVLTIHASEGWKGFLEDQPEDALHRQVAWLNGMWVPVEPGRDARSIVEAHPAAADLLADPKRWTDGDAVLFQAWYAEPPDLEPFRMTIRATEAKAEFLAADLRDLSPPTREPPSP